MSTDHNVSDQIYWTLEKLTNEMEDAHDDLIDIMTNSSIMTTSRKTRRKLGEGLVSRMTEAAMPK